MSNFIVSFSYRTYLAGEIMQRPDQESFEIWVVWQGSIAICEPTEFQEPILVYTKGAIVNLYQIMMDTTLPFTYRAIRDDEYCLKFDNTVRIWNKH